MISLTAVVRGAIILHAMDDDYGNGVGSRIVFSGESGVARQPIAPATVAAAAILSESSAVRR